MQKLRIRIRNIDDRQKVAGILAENGHKVTVEEEEFWEGARPVTDHFVVVEINNGDREVLTAYENPTKSK